MANSANDAVPFSFAEDVPNGLSVELRDSDLPFGRPREITAFDLGGELKTERIYLPGRSTPIYQTQQPRLRDLVVRGAFRDHLKSQDTGTSQVGHARAQRRLIEQIRRNANLLVISWGEESWNGLLVDAKYGIEGHHDSTYELTFAIGSTIGEGQATEQTSEQVATPIDIAALVQRDLAAARAQLAALALRASVLQTMSTILNAVDAAQQAARDLTEAVTTSATVSRAAANAAAARVDGAGRATQDAARAIIKLLSGTKTLAIVPDGDPGTTLSWLSASTAVLIAADSAIDRARSLRASARSSVTKAARVYVVRSGDTLESIARSELGDASRAGELGVRSDELRPGLSIRIPEIA